MSAGFPWGAPLSAHLAILPISSSLNEMSSLNFLIPIFLSMNHGGISPAEVARFIARAQGRASAYVLNDMGATPPLRWQFSHERCTMGAMSFVNVTSPRAAFCALGNAGMPIKVAAASIGPSTGRLLPLSLSRLVSLVVFMSHPPGCAEYPGRFLERL